MQKLDGLAAYHWALDGLRDSNGPNHRMSMAFEYTQPPKLLELTPAGLAAIDDDVIESSLVDYALAHRRDLDDEREAIALLPPALQMWYISFVVDAEVLSGGFNQFFFNPSGDLGDAAPAAFETMGMPRAASLVGRALDLLEQHAPALEAAAAAGTIESFMETYLDQPFSKLDELYAESEAEFRAARLKFIRVGAEDLCRA